MVARILAVVAVLAAIGAATWYFLWPHEPPPPPPASSSPAPAAAPPVAEGPKHPIEAVVEEKPLPPLKQSDPTMLQALGQLLGSAALQKFFNIEGMVPNIVATIDNLPRESYAQRLNPLKPIEGRFRVVGRDPNLAIAGENDSRYDAFVKMVEGVDTAAAVAEYRRMYPLFQQAYVDLGYPNGYFNDRLVEVIDHLIATPEVQGPIPVVTPHVLYEYANTELEELSAGRKAMLRAGPENARRLKAKLKEIRAQLVAGPTGR
jgi:hypothetical protein